MHGSDYFFTTLERVGGTTTLTLHGELDIATAPHLVKRLGALAAEDRPVRADLSGLTFVDCAGARPLLGAAPWLRCVAARPAVRQALEMMGSGLLSEEPDAGRSGLALRARRPDVRSEPAHERLGRLERRADLGDRAVGEQPWADRIDA